MFALPAAQLPPHPLELPQHKWLCTTRDKTAVHSPSVPGDKKLSVARFAPGLGKMELVGTEGEGWQPRGKAGMQIGCDHVKGLCDPDPLRKEGHPFSAP